jgi:hypothetical protein
MKTKLHLPEKFVLAATALRVSRSVSSKARRMLISGQWVDAVSDGLCHCDPATGEGDAKSCGPAIKRYRPRRESSARGTSPGYGAK